MDTVSQPRQLTLIALYVPARRPDAGRGTGPGGATAVAVPVGARHGREPVSCQNCAPPLVPAADTARHGALEID